MRFRLLVYAVLASMPAVGRADVFVFNATTNPMTGVYIPVGNGHYNLLGENENFYIPTLPGAPEGDQQINNEFAQSETFTTIPGLVCNPPGIPGCNWNYVSYFSTADGTPIPEVGGMEPGVGIYDATGDPVALMEVFGGSSAIYTMEFYTSLVSGAPLGDQPGYIQAALAAFPKIVATGTIQDAIDVHWEDGSFDSFEFILQPVPEPTSVIFLGTVVVAFGLTVRRKRRALL